MTARADGETTMRYDALIGTGGIGTGLCFALNGNHTLGREESRTGRFLGTRDYAKLHIIAHYVRTLIGPGFSALPVGRVGADEPGQRLCSEMAAAGLDLRYVRALDDAPTMNCICLLYPDGSGGNLTVADSACGRVDAAAVGEALPDFARFAGRGIALAVPEVPLMARAALLDLAAKYRFLRAASFTSEELRSEARANLLEQVDVLAINLDEAAALARVSHDLSPESIVERGVAAAKGLQPGVRIVVTAGAKGSWAWDGHRLDHFPAHAVQPVSAAGAGDAFFAGVLTGLAWGLSFDEAHALGSLAGAFSVTSPHTIHPDLNRAALAAFARESGAPLGLGLARILESEA